VPVLKQDNKIHICADFKSLDTKIGIEKYPLPKLKDILTVDSKIFSKLILCNAYLQLPDVRRIKNCL